MVIAFSRYKIIYFIFSGILILASLFFIIRFGLKAGIDFTGGSISEVEYAGQRPANQEVRDKLSGIDLGEISIQPSGERGGMIIKAKDVSEDIHRNVLEKLGELGQFEEKRFESIGPVIGKELKGKTQIVILLSLLLIVFYIILAFRKVSRPASSWQYGVVSLLVLFHDVLIPLGVFALLGEFFGTQITIPVITALLTVVGYAINNVVVVFDRIRENILKGSRASFAKTVDAAISQTLARQINTSLTTLFPLFAIFFLGGETLKYFSLTLILGITAGTYSSIFLAGQLLVSWLGKKGEVS